MILLLGLAGLGVHICSGVLLQCDMTVSEELGNVLNFSFGALVLIYCSSLFFLRTLKEQGAHAFHQKKLG